MRKAVLIFLSVTSFVPVIAVGQQPRSTITVADVMTSADLRATGVETLTSSQRAALDRWLQNYTAQVIAIAQGSSPSNSAYVALGSGHWVKEVASGGRMVTLEDGSIWEVNAIDRIYTMLWLPITSITVLESRTPIGEYKYVLLNTDDGEQAVVKYLGKG